MPRRGLYQRSKLKQTASALNGSPSWNVTPSLRVKVHVARKSSLVSQLSARPGTTSVVPGSSAVKPSRHLLDDAQRPRRRRPRLRRVRPGRPRYRRPACLRPRLRRRHNSPAPSAPAAIATYRGQQLPSTPHSVSFRHRIAPAVIIPKTAKTRPSPAALPSRSVAAYAAAATICSSRSADSPRQRTARAAARARASAPARCRSPRASTARPRT